MPSPSRFTLVALLLYGVFSATYLWVNYSLPVTRILPHQWGYPRPLVPDSVTQELVRQLIAQADSGGPPRAGTETAGTETVRLDFRISRVLLEHLPVGATIPVLCDAEVRYLYGQESASMIRQLYADKVLSAADTAVMHQQILHSTGFRLEARYLPGCTVIPVDTLKRLVRVAEHGLSGAVAHLRSQYRAEAVSCLSAPLFSLDQRYALISVTLNLGAFCGNGNTAGILLEQERGQWKPRWVLWE